MRQSRPEPAVAFYVRLPGWLTRPASNAANDYKQSIEAPFSARALTLLAALAVAGPAAGCGGGDENTLTPGAEVGTTKEIRPPNKNSGVHAKDLPLPHSGNSNNHGQRTKHKPKKPDRPAVPPAVSKLLRDYITALDAHDGPALCALFVPGALDALKLPDGSGCDGLSRSIGFKAPHGLPVWRDARVVDVKSIVSSGAGLRATVTIVDRYVNNPQPSIEDDVIYVKRSGGDWLIEQPSITIYRAIGTPDPPPSILAPPAP